MRAQRKGRPRKGKPEEKQQRAVEWKEKADRAAELEMANRELAFQNVEKEKRAEELLRATIELRYQNEQKEKRAAELAQAIKDLEAFAYVSSHHLQEPLRKIRSFVDRIMEREAPNLSEKGKHDLARIDVASARISQLIQDIYTYSRINVEEAAFDHRDPQELIMKVIDEFRAIIAEKKALIETDVRVAISLIPLQFCQVMRHLLDNAFKYSKTQAPPHIRIAGKMVSGNEVKEALLPASKRYACIEVSDNGMGFDADSKEAIFRMFEKLHPVEDYPGTGIGLAIVRKIMGRHGGFVCATGAPGIGASFRLYFPEYKC